MEKKMVRLSCSLAFVEPWLVYVCRLNHNNRPRFVERMRVPYASIRHNYAQLFKCVLWLHWTSRMDEKERERMDWRLRNLNRRHDLPFNLPLKYTRELHHRLSFLSCFFCCCCGDLITMHCQLICHKRVLP